MVKYFPFHLSYDLSFWAELNRLKLEEWMLEDKPRSITATIPQRPSSDHDYVLLLDHTSFTQKSDNDHISGKLYLFNTEIDYESADRQKILDAERDDLWKVIDSKEWLSAPNKLMSFIILAYADLKEFRYRVLSCVPTFASTVGVTYGNLPARALNGFDINNCQYLPCFYSNSAIYTLNRLHLLDLEKAWLIVSSIRSTHGQDVVSWQLRNLLVAIAFYLYVIISYFYKYMRFLVTSQDLPILQYSKDLIISFHIKLHGPKCI